MFWMQLDRVMGYWPVLLKGISMTVSLSILSLMIGVMLGFAFGMIRAGRNRMLAQIVGLYVDFFRGTPFLLQVFIVFFILPEIGIELSAFASGVVALSNVAACFIGEIVASGIKAVPLGQSEAAASSGFTRVQQMRHIVLPQAVRIVTPALVGQFVLLIKDSSVVSAIGLLDLTRSGWVIVQSVPNGLLVFGIIGFSYFVICYPLIYLSRRMERRGQATIL
ncbi:amino acid ABC transporter permease [Cypionkella sp.]|jgi:polar amino acid transport system permease protein|uniref:amino acid ABC transporter permease n=1 Tax=Cypionkella sp. TaxID=2811411 RepID=UPI00271B4AD6|nr:amino acid ABC transporter permease [Cypionkella sp.]MDO8986150.1 amino acid ABC transporter permease [Cypionkella sp.]MDP1594240.1 amino acid ABC transporter permease [Gallionella sp.]MDP2051557.1 amino acid ABC transporter permease [Cypionkella sp.]